MDAVAVWRSPGAPTEYVEARRANFGAGYGADSPPPLTPVRVAPPLADGPLTNAEEFEGGKAVALALRGGVNFVEKARAAQAAGAVALIVLNTEVENFVPNAPDDDDAADVSIPVVCVSAAFAEQLLAIADAAKADLAAINGAVERAVDGELRDNLDGGGDVAGVAAQIAGLAQGVFSGSKGSATLGLIFSANNLRRAIEGGDEGEARAALEGGTVNVNQWHGEPAAADGGFDPLLWEVELPAARSGAGAGAEGAVYTSRGSPPLLVASWLGHEPIVRLLIAAVPGMIAEALDPTGEGLADIDEPPPELHPANLRATDCEPTTTQDAWAEAQTNTDGWTPLIAACWRGQLPVVKLLLRGRNVMSLAARAQTAVGGTALSAACDGGHW